MTIRHVELRPADRTGLLGMGTLACPQCDAPVALTTRRARPDEALECPVCGHAGAVRDFLSMRAPVRPARVLVRIV